MSDGAGDVGQVLKKMQQSLSRGISKGHCLEAKHLLLWRKHK